MIYNRLLFNPCLGRGKEGLVQTHRRRGRIPPGGGILGDTKMGDFFAFFYRPSTGPTRPNPSLFVGRGGYWHRPEEESTTATYPVILTSARAGQHTENELQDRKQVGADIGLNTLAKIQTNETSYVMPCYGGEIYVEEKFGIVSIFRAHRLISADFWFLV